MEIQDQIGERIRELRKRRDMTVESLGRLIGVDKATITRYERGYVKKISRMNLEGIANALGVPISYLTEGVGEIADEAGDKANYSEGRLVTDEYIIHVEDNQMAPRMKIGDTLYCVQESSPHDGTVAVIRKGDGIIIRNVITAGSTIILTSDNPSVPVETLNISDFESGEYVMIARVVKMEASF